MAFDPALDLRIRKAVAALPGVTFKKMFGGVCYLHEGRMFAGIVGDELMVRVGPEAHREALRRPHTRPMDFTGRPMAGFLFVAPEGVSSDKALSAWLERGLSFAKTQPVKKPKSKKRTGGKPR